MVVIPLVAVANDMEHTLKKAGIYATQWDLQSTLRSTVVIVSAETATSKAFAKYITTLYLSGVLARAFFDEAHLIVTDVGYREKLAELKNLRVPIQLVLLTATLPPSYQEELEKDILLPDAPYIRAMANRVNIKYRQVMYSGDTYALWIKQRIKELEGRMARGNKMIVFVKSRKNAEHLANDLGCGTYMSKQSGQEDVFRNWELGHAPTIVATTALVAGINVNNVVCVVHVDIPFSVIGFVQESG